MPNLYDIAKGTMTAEMHELLEALIDTHGLANVVDGLAETAREKAEHLRANWGDGGAARGWDKAANKLDTLAARTDYPWMVR